VRYILLLTVLLASNVFAATDFDETKAAAEQGDAVAQYNLGVMYEKGEGVPENDAEAVKWYRKAADQGNADAQLILGYMYEKGKGVPENDAEAVKWYRKAAEQGSELGQTKLGLIYYFGGDPTKVIRAYVWLSMAKTQGNRHAVKGLIRLKPKMTKQQIAQAQALAAKCYESDYKDCD
jgi:uncharacterized protein